MEFGHAKHSESLLYPSELLSLQVHHGLSLFDLAAWANDCVCLWSTFPSFLQQNIKDKTKNEICRGPFFEALCRMGINGRSPDLLVSCWKMKVLSSVQPWQMLRLWFYDPSLSHQHDPLYVCVPTVTHLDEFRCDMLAASSLVPSYSTCHITLIIQ